MSRGPQLAVQQVMNQTKTSARRAVESRDKFCRAYRHEHIGIVRVGNGKIADAQHAYRRAEYQPSPTADRDRTAPRAVHAGVDPAQGR